MLYDVLCVLCPSMAHRPGLWLLKILEPLMEQLLFTFFCFFNCYPNCSHHNRHITLQFLSVNFFYNLLKKKILLNLIQIPLYYPGISSLSSTQRDFFLFSTLLVFTVLMYNSTWIIRRDPKG